MRETALVLALLAAGATAAQAQTSSPSISVENAWARATPSSAKTGAVYLTIVDHGAADRLVAASTPVAGQAELHETIRDGNVMRMRPVDGLTLPINAPVTFAPGGYHIMLMQLKQPLTRGQHFPLLLRFQNAGTIETTVIVQAIGAGSPTRMDGPGHGMEMGTKSKP